MMNPTVLVPPWPHHPDDADGNGGAGDYSPYYLQDTTLSAFQRYLPSNDTEGDSDSEVGDTDVPVDAFSCDQFRMYEFKVRKCARARSHDWTECPYAHPGEKARRRDPRKILYCGTSCPEFRKGSCTKGDSCEFAHGVFECWLHPSRYRTQPCKDGTNCRRRVCFFAHTAEQLRILPSQSVGSVDLYDGSPMRKMMESSCVKSLSFISSPADVSPPASSPAESPPVSPMGKSLNEMVASLRNLQLGKGKSSSWNVPKGLGGSPSFGSPRGPVTRPGFWSLPTTPTQAPARGGSGVCFDIWEESCEEEPVMERVESGRNIRAKMFERLSKENSLNGSDPGSSGGAPDVGWISELVK